MNRSRVSDLLAQIEDAAGAGQHDVDRGMPQDDVEELLADIQHVLDQLFAEVRT